MADWLFSEAVFDGPRICAAHFFRNGEAGGVVRCAVDGIAEDSFATESANFVVCGV
jgi:hypothetical protein